MDMFPRLGYHTVSLIAELHSQLTMPPQDLILRLNLFLVSCTMCCDLCRACTLSADLLQMFLDLFPSWTRCVQILLCVSLDFRLMWQPITALRFTRRTGSSA